MPTRKKQDGMHIFGIAPTSLGIMNKRLGLKKGSQIATLFGQLKKSGAPPYSVGVEPNTEYYIISAHPRSYSNKAYARSHA